MKKILFAVLVLGLIPALASATGLLIPTDGSLPPLGIKYHRASAKITDRVAVTHVDQVFCNNTDHGSARTMQDFTMTVEIQSATPIKSLYSPSHNTYARKKDDHHATAGFEKTAALLDRDFELFIALSEKDIGLNLLTYRQPGEPRFFMLMASPKSDYSEKEIIGKRISFVIDTSGSMAGEKIHSAKQALKYSHPVLADLALDFGPIHEYDVFPPRPMRWRESVTRESVRFGSKATVG